MPLPRNRRHKGTTEKYDWDTARVLYQTGMWSQRALARHLKIPIPALLNRANEEDWAGQRKAFRELMAEKALAKQLQARLQHLAALRSNTQDVVDNCIAILSEKVARSVTRLDMEELERALTAASKAYDLGVKALGLEHELAPKDPAAAGPKEIRVAWAPDLTPEEMLAQACKKIGADPAVVLAALEAAKAKAKDPGAGG
jgi:hypothetical protein